MKRFFLLSLLSVAIFFTSCSGPMRIEKRRYTGGWYVAAADHKKNTHAVTVPITLNPSTNNDSLVQPIAQTSNAHLNPSPVPAPAAEQVAAAAPVAKTKSPVAVSQKENSITKQEQHAQKAFAKHALRRNLEDSDGAIGACTWLGMILLTVIGIASGATVGVVILLALLGLAGGFICGLFVGLLVLFS
jgi:hypothetical protein